MSLFRFFQSAPFSYLFAFLCCALVTIIKIQFDAFVGHVTPFLLYFGAIVLASWIGGLGAGIFAVAVSTALVSHYFLRLTEDSFFEVAAGTRTFIFLSEGVLVAALTSLARTAQKRLGRQLERQMALARIAQAAVNPLPGAEKTSEPPRQFYDLCVAEVAQIMGASRVSLWQIELGDNDERFVLLASCGGD